MFKPSFRERGVALYLVLMTVLIVAVLAGVILTIILSQARLSYHQIGRTRAYYAALAGMNLAMENLRLGKWDTGSYAIGRCCTAICSENCTCDFDIPYCVNITIVAANATSRQINLSVDYTYVP